MVAPRNITPDKETGIGNWTDGEKIRAIREGVGRDGTTLFPMMGYERYRHMSYEDVYSFVAYLNTLAPVRNPVPRSRIDFPVSLLIKERATTRRPCPAAGPLQPSEVWRVSGDARRLHGVPHARQKG